MTEDNTKNMELWDAVCTTKTTDTQRVTQRGGFTAICAQSQIKAATEQWGPYGTVWGMDSLKWTEIRNAAGELIEVALDADFKYPGGFFPISSDSAYRAGNDTRKKLLTDCTTKALSKLGFNADVFLGLYDDNKYIAERKAEEQGQQAPPQQQPQQPAPQQKPTAMDEKKTQLFATWGKDMIGKAMLALINPDTGDHFKPGEKIRRMAELNELERMLNTGEIK